MPNLLSIERVCLFGIIFKGFSPTGEVPDATKQKEAGGHSLHPSNAIYETLKTDPENPGPVPCLARIYAMSYEGGLYTLPRPTVFLVHGAGSDPEDLTSGGLVFKLDDQDGKSTGLANKLGVFADDLKAWTYDRDDMTVRVEIATGGLDELLLEPLFCPGGGGGGSRADMTSRADMASRADMTSRADMAMRHRYR